MINLSISFNRSNLSNNYSFYCKKYAARDWRGYSRVYRRALGGNMTGACCWTVPVRPCPKSLDSSYNKYQYWYFSIKLDYLSRHVRLINGKITQRIDIHTPNALTDANIFAAEICFVFEESQCVRRELLWLAGFLCSRINSISSKNVSLHWSNDQQKICLNLHFFQSVWIRNIARWIAMIH